MQAPKWPNDTAQALQDSETRLQQVLDNTSALVFAKDLAGRYLFVNHEFEALSGLKSEQVLGRKDEEIFAPDLAARFRHNDLRVLREQRAIEVEETADFGRGRRVYVASKFPLFDSNGRAYAVCGIATDITDRKRLEEAWSAAALAVSQSEDVALYRQLVRLLATILGTEAAFVATYDPAHEQQLGMLAFYLDGEIHENFRYAATGTPCETVVGQQFRLYGSNLIERFPLDEDFRRLGFVSYAGHPLFDAQGKALGLIAVVSRRPLEQAGFIESVLRIFAVRVVAELERDASRRALRASERNYREIFEASDDAIFVHDWDTGAILDVNPRACEVYGYTRDELLAADVGALGAGEPPYAREDALRWIETAKREGHARFEWRRRNRDGSLHWDEVRLKAVQIGGQRRVLAITRDITERKLADEAIRASEEQYRVVFNASTDALVLWNSRSERVDVNPAYERMYGYSRCEVLAGLRTQELPPDLRHRQQAIIARTLAGDSYHGEFETVGRGGRRFPIEVRTIPIQYRGEPHVLAIIRDITERKEAEEQRAALEARLRQAQRMQAIGQLTGGIAHDFNNLLTTVLGYVVLASERESSASDPRLRVYLEQARKSCERARDLIQQMLMFSRGQRGTPRPVVLQALVDDALANLRAQLGSGVQLRVEPDETSTYIEVDPVQAGLVVTNLCLNARDAMNGTGELTVRVRRRHIEHGVCAGCRAPVAGPYVELGVADSGEGISTDVAERIFRAFLHDQGDGAGHRHGARDRARYRPRTRRPRDSRIRAGSRLRVPGPVAGDRGARRGRSACT